MRGVILIFLLFFLTLQGFSQYYSTGQDPASIRWRQIETDHFKLVYPAPFEKKAQYIANVMELICRNETATLRSRVPRIPVILHTHTVISNGLTVWAPKRIELYTCPPQQTYAEEWLEQLVIHEYRHAIQISKINQGFSKALYYIFGEQITGGILGLYVPSWFLEGDATVTETAMTKTGRGRSALFESILRAQVVEKGPYSYDKATLGSYKTFTPDAYSLGYYLVGQSRVKYGPGLWNTALDKVAKYPFMIVPFNSGIHKITGKWKTQLYREALADLDSIWTRQLAASIHPDIRYITKRDPVNHVDYNHPILLNDSTILADKSSMDDVDRFVLIDRKTGNEHILLTPGYHIGGTASLGGDYLAWSEPESDARWSNRDFAKIRIYNFKTRERKDLTRNSRYFAPAVSPDGQRVAAVYNSRENLCSIDILEIPSGRLLNRFTIPDYGQAITPNWSPDGAGIIFTLLTEKGETLATLNTFTGKIRSLLPESYDEFTGPAFYYKHYVIYSVDHSGAENIYALDTLTNAVFKVTTGRFATFDPDFTSDKKFLVCSDYTSDGMMVAEIPVDPATWIPLRLVKNQSYRLYDALSRQETANIQDSVTGRNICKMNDSDKADLIKDTINGKIYPTRKYSKILNLFYPHSWAPASFDITNMTFNPGVMLLSQNALSTMFAGAGWAYDINEKTGKFYATLSYRGWYPELDFRFDIGNRAAYARYHSGSKTYRFTWQETNFKAYVSIPWNFSRGRYSRSLQPIIGTTLIGVKHEASTPAGFTSGWIQTMDFEVNVSQYLHSNQKDVYPRFGQSINITYRNTPFGSNNMGSIFGTAANLYFPGIVRHHGIWIYGGFQQRNDMDLISYSFSNLIAYPRGYSGAYDNNLLSLSANYKLPLWYPDFSFGSVIYLKRLKLNLYYDWANGKNPGYVNTYQSTGGELTADFHILRFVAPVEMGVRSIYYPSTGEWAFEFLYSISY